MIISKKTLLAETKRNTKLLAEIENAEDFRIAYKTKDGWKRLIAPPYLNLRGVSKAVIGWRLNKLAPQLVDTVIDEALEAVVAELNK